MSLPPPPGHRSDAVRDHQQGVGKIIYDDDQKAIINCESKNIVAEATAGAGKTSTAIGFAQARPDAKFLYLCFGKANQLDAEKRFGVLGNVECRTTHSLAYSAVGYKYAKANQVTFNWAPREFASQLRLSTIREAAIVQSVLTQFFVSTAQKVDESHVVDVAAKWDLDPNDIDFVLQKSRAAWQQMQLVGSGVSMPPDAYLKIWALSSPKLSKYSNIILDEAQDTNPVTSRIVETQQHAQKLLIGDRHQSIFLFRGALNAMEAFSATGATVLTMPKTWRFGPQIAGYANTILEFFKNEQTKIIGAGPTGAAQQKLAVLSRTNIGLFDAAAEVLGRGTHWLGGIDGYKLGTINDAYLLKVGRKQEIRDPSLRTYNSWSDYLDEAQSTKDSSAKMMISVVEKYNRDIPYLLKCFKENALATESGARQVLATAHKAKGMEWSRVRIGEDFSCIGDALDSLMMSPHEPLSPEQVQEINLMYVAITRAKHNVELNTDTKHFIQNIAFHKNALLEAKSRNDLAVSVEHSAAVMA